MASGGSTARRAFTLVELLVVVSVLALLMAILIPALRNARAQAKSAKCLIQQRNIFHAAVVFSEDHGGRSQLIANDGDSVVGVNSVDRPRRQYAYDTKGELLCWPVAFAGASGVRIQGNADWGVLADNFAAAQALESQLPDSGFENFVCPADKVQLNTPLFPEGSSLRVAAATAQSRYWGRLSYGINEDVLGVEGRIRENIAWPAVWRNGVMGESTLTPWRDAGLRLRGQFDRVYDTATCLLTVDAGPESIAGAATGDWGLSHQLGFANSIASARVRGGPLFANFVQEWPRRIPLERHHIRGALNVGFIDGHAATIKAVEWEINPLTQTETPTRFNTPVRVSPYQP